MLPQSQTQSAAGVTPWIPLDRGQFGFGVGLSINLNSAANLTYKVEHTFDPLGVEVYPVSMTRATTVVTVTFGVNHNLNVGDSIVVRGGNTVSTDVFDGTFQVASVSSVTVITYTVTNTGATVAQPGVRVVTLRVRPHATLVAQTTSQDGNYAFPVTACRLNITAYTAGSATLIVDQGRK